MDFPKPFKAILITKKKIKLDRQGLESIFLTPYPFNDD